MAKYRKRRNNDDGIESVSVSESIIDTVDVVPTKELPVLNAGVYSSEENKPLTALERRKRTDSRRRFFCLKPVKLFIPEDIVSLIHERMIQDGYNKGTPYRSLKSVQAEDVSEFLTEIFRQHQATRPDPIFNIRCHLHKLQQMAMLLKREGSPDHGIAFNLNHFGYVKPSYLTDKTVGMNDETFSDRLAVHPADYNSRWTANDVALLLDDKKVEAILRMVKPEDDIASSTIKRTKRSK